MTEPSTGTGDTRAEVDVDPASAKYWLAEIEAAKTRSSGWMKKAKQVIERYRDERDEANKNQRKVNILWSNVEVLKSALFAQLGNPDVRRAFPKPGAANKVARTAALLLERALTSCGNLYDAEYQIECAVEDMLLPGRGQCWLEYEAEIAEDDTIGYQSAKFCYVAWDQFMHGPGRRYDDWPWVARSHQFTRDELIEKFPEHGKKIQLGYTLPECDKNDKSEIFKRAIVWEIWDKTTKQRIYIAEDYPLVIKSDSDPLRLRSFFPCPRPLDAVKTTSDAMPIPEFCEYQDQAAELDRVTSRINKLTELLKYCGVYDEAMPDAQKLMDLAYLDDGQFEPLKGAAAWRDAGGLEKAFWVRDMAPIVAALQQLYQQRGILIQTIYEVTGISDIIRGSSDPGETLGAQKLKANFGSQRMQKRQKEVQRFVRDLYRLKGELIAEHFEHRQLSDMTGILLPTQAERQQARDFLASVEQAKQQQAMMAQQAQQAQQQPPQPPQMQGPGPQQQLPPPQPQPEGMAA
jgi:hypothetical protein